MHGGDAFSGARSAIANAAMVWHMEPDCAWVTHFPLPSPLVSCFRFQKPLRLSEHVYAGALGKTPADSERSPASTHHPHFP